MPPFNFYRRRWYPNRWRKTRRWIRRRRPRPPFRRRFHRRNWVRRRRLFTKRHKKLKKLKLSVWQPRTIHKCRIKGLLCLTTCGKGRVNHNSILTMESYVPESEPGGGAWSILQVSLRVLWDEYTAFRNWWTSSNQGLPLTRYLGGQLKFYRSKQTDYIAIVNTCPPFDVTRDIYLNTQPSRAIMHKYKIIVPRLDRKIYRKPYVKKNIKPPALFSNKWFFQREIYNQPFFTVQTSCCSLDQVFGPDTEINTNLSFISLNCDFFQNPQWGDLPDTGYRPKYTGTSNTYLFRAQNGTYNGIGYKTLTPLFNTKTITQGKPLTAEDFETLQTQITDKQYWGNPFDPNYLHSHTYWYGPYPTQQNYKTGTLVQLHEVFLTCRYNPFRDKSKGNKVYLKSTSLQQGSMLTLPQNEQILIQDMPLWLIFWAWEDWILKSKPIQHLLQDYQIIIQSKYIYPPRTAYVPLDKYFAETTHETNLTETDKANWHPKVEMQQYSTQNIALTGPLSPKITTTKSIETHMYYNLFFKWGGCPAPMENITDPAEQETFPTPGNIIQGLEIQDPKTPEQYTIWDWDERRGIITAKGSKRIKSHIETSTYFTEYGAKDPETQAPQQKIYAAPPQTEKTEDYINQLKQLQRDLKHRIHELLKTKKLFPIL
uniref:Capsid protein n=1 Tax=Betatorquevirus homini1 TaxID=3048395 RepID=A0AAU7SSX9_9VIRU